MLCPITPYPSSTTPSTEKTRGHPNTKTPQTLAATMTLPSTTIHA